MIKSKWIKNFGSVNSDLIFALAIIIFFSSVWMTMTEAFLAPPSPSLHLRDCGQHLCDQTLFSSQSEDVPSEESPLEAMRRILEAAWDAEKMGRVPLDATAGANEAYSAIMAAAIENDGENGVFFVDLLLPSYDVTQGEHMYDEVLATEFCISLAKCLRGKTEILVRDQKILQTVEKVLNARERLEEDDALAAHDDDDDIYDGEYDEDDNEDYLSSGDNDSDDISIDEDVDSFRKKLTSGWDGTDSDPPVSGQDQDLPSPVSPSPSTPSNTFSKSIMSKKNKPYRLASLFGSARITMGADMPQDVVRAVRNNALAAGEEENIIILSAHGLDEMVGVRAIVDSYQSQKKIILVNCQFKQMPRELEDSETVYSILPLIAREKGTKKALPMVDIEGAPSRIVVLRRFPKDWEIFVDVGNGFELAETVPMSPSNKRGLPMEMIAESLKRYMKSL